MIVMVVALVLGCLLEYFFTRERITEENIKNAEAAAANGEVKAEPKKVTMGQQIKICVKDKFWWMLMIFWFLYQFGGMMKNNDMSFFSQALTGGSSVSSVINTVGAVPTALGMLVVWPLSNKIGTQYRRIPFRWQVRQRPQAPRFELRALLRRSLKAGSNCRLPQQEQD